MSRKKQTKRKVKVTDAHSRRSPKPSGSNSVRISSDEPRPGAEQDVHVATQQTSSTPGRRSDEQTSIYQSGSMFVPLVMIKTEPNFEVEQQNSCSCEENTRHSPSSEQESSNAFKSAKIKRERLSLDSSMASKSIHPLPNSTPTMDLGSHLEQSLSSLQSGTELTWSQLLEAKNFPKVQIPGNVQKNVVIKREKPDLPVIVVSSTDDDSESQSFMGTSVHPSSSLEKSASLHGKEKVSFSGISGPSKRFSKNYEGGNLLDFSKKSIPPEIRRVLASKYGVTKRHDEGHSSGSVVPNLSKSRSRFTHSSKKSGATDSEDEGNSQAKPSHAIDTGKDFERSKDTDGGFTHTSTSSFSDKGTLSSSIPKSKSASPTEYSGIKALKPVAAKVLNRRRFSSSAYEGRRSAQSSSFLASNNHEAMTVTDKLQRRGLVDLGSHYGSLLKDSPPRSSGRNSKSPYDESTSSTAFGKRTDTLGNASSSGEHRGAAPDEKLLSQMAWNDLNAGAGLSRGARRTSFVDDPGEKSVYLRRETVHYEGGDKLNLGKSVTGRMSRSPVSDISKTRNPEKNMIDLGSTSGSDQRRGTQRSPTRSSSRSPLASPMIDLNTSTRHLNERVPHVRGRSPFSSSYFNEFPGHFRLPNKEESVQALGSNKLLNDFRDGTNREIPRSSSRSPMLVERSGDTKLDAKEGMIELGSGKVLHDYLKRARHSISRSSSRSPVRTDQRSDTHSPVGNEAIVELGSGRPINEDLNTKRIIPRSSSRSPVATDVAGKTGHANEDEPMIELNSMTRLTEQPRSTSQSPRSNPGAANTEEAMIDLNRVGRLHERRGAPRMKPLDAMIDLSSMENPMSPLSPGVGNLPFSSFPSQAYRPHNRQRYPYKSKHYQGRPLRNSSPGFSPRLPFGPRFNYPSSPRYRLPGASMINLGGFGKSNDFQGMVSSRSSEVPLRPVQAHSSGPIPKRRHSLDSQDSNEPAKRPRMVVPDQRPEMKVEGSGVRLNVSDLLQLEREEQKYIQDLSSVQSQLTEIRFKMQRMQQDLERLQSSEMEIKQRIDLVRAKRVKILKDAQDHEESHGKQRTTDVTSEDDISTRRVSEGDEERDGQYNRGSLGFERYRAERGHDVESVPKSERKDTQAPNEGKSTEFRTSYTAEGERENVKSSSIEKNSDKNKINDSSSRDRSTEQNENNFGNISENRNVALRLPTGCSSDTSNPVRSTYSPGILHTQHYPVMSSSNRTSIHTQPKATLGRAGWERSSQNTQDKISNEIETFESSDGSTITLNSDGTLVLRKNQTESGQLARKRSNPTVLEVLEEVRADFDAKRTECEGITSNESQQFLGCLEITSTTDEPLVAEDDGPKEVLAEKERECLASKLRCDRDRISSTVPSLENEQDDANIGSVGEMDFIGHTDAVCCILPYKGKLFSASADRTVKAFDLKTGECVKTFEGHELAVNCLQISGFGGKAERLFTGANDQTVRAYSVKSTACTHKFSFRGRVMCLHVAFGKLFVGLSSGFVAVIDLKTNECIDQFNCHEPSRISCLSSATEGQRSLLCTGSFDSTITIRDESTGLLLRHIKDHKLTVLCMQVVENIVFSGSADTVVQSHNINTGELVRSYTGHTMSVSGLHALGGVLVTSSLDRIIRCFDIKTGDLLQLYGGNTDMIFSLSVVGEMIYTGCRDGRVSGIKLDLRKYHCCKWGDCSLKFGLLSHLKQHVQDHINQTVDFKACFWEGCIHKFPRGKQLDVIQAASEHILGHVPNTEG